MSEFEGREERTQGADYTLEEKVELLMKKLQQALLLGQVAKTAEDGAELSPMALIKDRAKRMKELATVYGIIKPVYDSINAEFDQIRKKTLPDLMAAEDVRTITLDGIGRVQLAGDCYASIPAEQQEAAFEWLRGNNYGDLIKETVHSATLKAWAKEGLAAGRELPEGVFKVEPYVRASIVKVKGSSKKVD